MTTHWLLRHPAIEGICLVSDTELVGFWDRGMLPESVTTTPIVLMPFELFLAAAKLKARTKEQA